MKIRLSRKISLDVGVTVVVPCYNYGHFLPELVAGILAQERVSPQVIIVDDASPDGSALVAAQLASKYSQVTLIAHEKNMGHIATYNDGLARVETEFVVLLSADDLLAEGALARAVDLMVCHPSVGLVYGYPREFQDDVGSLRRRFLGPRTWTIWKGADWTSLSCFRGRNFILSPEVVMRTAAMRQTGSYDPKLPHSGDLEYWLRTAQSWDIARINGATQAYYRVHGQNMHLTTYATMKVDLEHRMEAFRVLQPSEPAQFAKARRAICREAIHLANRMTASGEQASDALVLLDFATELLDEERGSGLRRRHEQARRATDKNNWMPLQRAKNGLSIQKDRLRWRFWALMGVS